MQTNIYERAADAYQHALEVALAAGATIDAAIEAAENMYTHVLTWSD